MNLDRAETPRAAIYARYSSDLQNPRSIDDQIHICRAHVRALGGTVAGIYPDPARTGTTMRDRPALSEMMTAARQRRFDVVVAEALDRISRDQEDICHVYKRLRFHDVDLVTLEDGEITAMHVGIRGLMNDAYVRNMAAKVSRGLHGVARQGRIPCPPCYGYRIANRLDERGQAIRGLREIDPEQARVVRRIFTLYAAGLGGARISQLLNKDRIPAPGGKHWSAAAILGDPRRRTGVLHQDLYRGLLVYGVQQLVRNPDTGKREARRTPAAGRTVHDMPHLRIVDDDLWAAAHAQYRARPTLQPECSLRGSALPLTPLLRCGRCGGPMRVLRTGRYSCLARRRAHACDMKLSIAVPALETETAAALHNWARKHSRPAALLKTAFFERARRRAGLRTAVCDAERRLDHLLQAVETGNDSASVRQRIDECERELATNRLQLEVLPPLPNRTPEAVAHDLPHLLRRLRHNIAHRDGEARLIALHRLRDLLDRIDVTLGPRRSDIDIAIHPRRDALVAFALRDPGDDG